MHKDFHLYGTYLAARLAGRDSTESKLIACAAQATDDFTYGKYSTCMTNFDTFKSNLDVSTTCWSIFHFLPGGIDSNLTDDRKYITKPSGVLYDLLFAEACSMVGTHTGVALAKTGIICHILADTYAHQGFSGQSSSLNIISDLVMCDKVSLNLKNKETVFVPKILMKGFNNIRIGHGSAGNAPDLSWITFKYKEPDCTNPGKTRKVSRDNAVIFADAFAALYKMLGGDENNASGIKDIVKSFLTTQRESFDTSSVKSYSEDRDTCFRDMLEKNTMLPRQLNVIEEPVLELKALEASYPGYLDILTETASKMESTSKPEDKKRLLFDTNDFLTASMHIRSDVLTEIYHE